MSNVIVKGSSFTVETAIAQSNAERGDNLYNAANQFSLSVYSSTEKYVLESPSISTVTSLSAFNAATGNAFLAATKNILDAEGNIVTPGLDGRIKLKYTHNIPGYFTQAIAYQDTNGTPITVLARSYVQVLTTAITYPSKTVIAGKITAPKN